MNVKPCRVTFGGIRYIVKSNGEVYRADATAWDLPLIESDAKIVRQEASRQRHNRNARERNAAMRDLGMKRTPYGWE